MTRILIETGKIALEAELNDGPTAAQVAAALPIEGRVNRWGDEIYFDIGMAAGEEPGARTEMAVGELGYWPTGTAFCIFFGPTPVSHGSEPRAYSPVNVLGRVLGDATLFGGAAQGAPIRITRAEAS
jgi:hypothetical protein